MRRTVQGDLLQQPAIAGTLELQVGSPFSRPLIDGSQHGCRAQARCAQGEGAVFCPDFQSAAGQLFPAVTNGNGTFTRIC